MWTEPTAPEHETTAIGLVAYCFNGFNPLHVSTHKKLKYALLLWNIFLFFCID